jgi:hypothetical protein
MKRKKSKTIDEYVLETLLKIPENIMDKVLKEVEFFDMPTAGMIHKVDKKVIIVLALRCIKTKKQRYNAIAHEIAHFILGHHNQPDKPPREKEMEADAKIVMWGFKPEYKSYDFQEYNLSSLR